jgi:hypothetical protein
MKRDPTRDDYLYWTEQSRLLSRRIIVDADVDFDERLAAMFRLNQIKRWLAAHAEHRHAA